MTVLRTMSVPLGLSALAIAGLVAASPAAAAPLARGMAPLAADVQTGNLVEQVQWRGRGRGWRGRGWNRGYRYGYRRGPSNGAIAAGVIGGLALGAIAAGAANAPAYAPAPVYGGNDWLAYCSSKYRSFDPASGTYLGYDGLRHPCQ